MAEQITKEDVINFIANMTVLDLSELVKELEDKFGVKAAAPMMAMAGPAPAAEAAVQEEQTEFTVLLTGVGDKKIQVIKEVRAITNLGLKEAKDAVENLPSTIKEGIPRKRRRTSRSSSNPPGALRK